LSALYEERWIFDKNGNIFESRFGLLIFSRKKSIPLAELARVELDSFVKGRADDSQASLEDEQPSDSPQEIGKGSLRSILRVPQRRHVYRIIRLRVLDKQEKAYLLDSTRVHRIEDFRLIGRKIADFCEIPFQGTYKIGTENRDTSN
jgi:hypothetical protein